MSVLSHEHINGLQAEGYFFSADTALLDFMIIHNFLAQSNHGFQLIEPGKHMKRLGSGR